MTALLELLGAVVRSYPAIFANPVLDVAYLLVLVLVAAQYSRVQSLEERLFGRAKNRAIYHTAVAIALGLVAGLIASLLMVVVGVTVSDTGIGYLLPVAVVLFLIHPRFLCFSYSGGLLSLSYLIFGWPEINVAAIAALVACLHAAEAILIRLSGHSCATPLYFAGEGGDTLGGFNLQRFWPIPLLALYVIRVPDVSALPGVIHLPDWWPLIKAAETTAPGTPVFAMMPVVAALGYGDLALSSTPKEKARETSKNLFLFSVLLLIFAVTASRLPAFSWVAALFAPLAHEVVIKLGARREMSDPPIHGSASRGVGVLDVFGDGPAARAGLKSGDVILEARGMPLENRQDLVRAVDEPGDIWLSVRSKDSVGDPDMEASSRQVLISRESEPIGLIPVPDKWDDPMAGPGAGGPLAILLKKVFRRIKG